MKHNLKITALLLVFFLLAQYLGLAILYQYIDPVKSLETGQTEFKDLPIGERPPVQEKVSYLPVILAILIGTAIFIILIKYHLIWVWKVWYLIAVVISLIIAWSVWMRKEIALLLALVFGIWKVFKPNVWVQNITELFLYGGLAAIFVPLFNVLSVSVLLILISIYDIYAVWKSKHMIKLAKIQMKQKFFAGLFWPYKKKVPLKKGVVAKARIAVLGGGDIGFPLIFAGVVLKEWGLLPSLIIPLFALIALAGLFYFSKEKKFYPAMPFISAGCFVGLLVSWLIFMI